MRVCEYYVWHIVKKHDSNLYTWNDSFRDNLFLSISAGKLNKNARFVIIYLYILTMTDQIIKSPYKTYFSFFWSHIFICVFGTWKFIFLKWHYSRLLVLLEKGIYISGVHEFIADLSWIMTMHYINFLCKIIHWLEWPKWDQSVYFLRYGRNIFLFICNWVRDFSITVSDLVLIRV